MVACDGVGVGAGLRADSRVLGVPLGLRVLSAALGWVHFSMLFVGSKLRRWMMQGPCARMAAMCDATPYLERKTTWRSGFASLLESQQDQGNSC